ncbi:MAG: four helix bundle protein [Marinilabiliales bacterium]|nr:four helix bundle protein [Marinilabiliales bacterium]
MRSFGVVDFESSEKSVNSTKPQQFDQMEKLITSHSDLTVFQSAFNTAVRIHEYSMNFPTEERYSLTDQIRRSSRSVAANLAEAYRKRRYPKSFVSKLSDSEGEAAETQVWLRFAHTFHYLNDQDFDSLNAEYARILNQIVKMIRNPEKWSL